MTLADQAARWQAFLHLESNLTGEQRIIDIYINAAQTSGD
jgi:hypothetical protein